MASYPALDVRFAPGPGAGALHDLLYAELDPFEPVAIEEREAGDGWRVFFRTSSQRDAAHHDLAAALGGHVVYLTSLDVDDENWAARSQADLKAVRVGAIVVAPPWDVPLRRRDPGSGIGGPEDPPSTVRGDIVIVIQPSMGFGTGHHETTRLCLELLQSIKLKGRRVIDAGTGSGVLAIAAARLGAAAIIAIDNDPDAVQSARENVRTNRLDASIDLRLVDLDDLREPADVLLANLTGAVLIAQAQKLGRRLNSGGIAILSGFSPDEIDSVVDAWVGWSVRAERRERDWAALMLTR